MRSKAKYSSLSTTTINHNSLRLPHVNRRLAFRLVVAVGVTCLLVFGFGHLKVFDFANKPAPVALNREPQYRIQVDFADQKKNPRFHVNDVCRMMPDCFPRSKSFGEFGRCQKDLALTMDHYDSGFLIESLGENGQERAVGFLSALPLRRQNRIFIFIYNVCIDPERRRKGLASKLLNGFVEEYIAHTNWPRSRIFLALDVDLRTPMAKGALSLYLKLGFVRWMEPCKNVYENDVTKVINPPRNSDQHLGQIIADPEGYVANYYSAYERGDRETPYPTHFCLYKKYEDSFDRIGKTLIDKISQLDAKFPNAVKDEEEEE